MSMGSTCRSAFCGKSANSIWGGLISRVFRFGPRCRKDECESECRTFSASRSKIHERMVQSRCFLLQTRQGRRRLAWGFSRRRSFGARPEALKGRRTNGGKSPAPLQGFGKALCPRPSRLKSRSSLGVGNAASEPSALMLERRNFGATEHRTLRGRGVDCSMFIFWLRSFFDMIEAAGIARAVRGPPPRSRTGGRA